MLEIRRPEPNAALTWMAVWLIALIALALMPMDSGTTARADFAGNSNEIEYSHGTDTKPQGAMDYAARIRG